MGDANTTGHNWHVHDAPLNLAGVDCSVAGPHYNPRNVDITLPEYATMCGSTTPALQMECEIGDLSNKGAPFNVGVNRVIQQFYSDTDLPLLSAASPDDFLINDRSTVIHMANLGGPRIGCANLTTYQPLEAVARFNENGLTGSIQFYQRSPYDSTQVFVNLKGLGSGTAGYHVHVYPVGPEDSPDRCANRYTGGHLNPTGITMAGTTSDQFEVGDLSGKFGSLSGQNDFYREYVDPNIPLFGPFSILDRSLVIHEDDADGTRFVCSNIQRIRRVVQVTTPINTDTFNGSITFMQPADDPYSETTIIVDLTVKRMIQLTPNSDNMVEFNWSYRQNPTGATQDCTSLSELAVFNR
jgi:Cu/Zn superoxide dismutase